VPSKIIKHILSPAQIRAGDRRRLARLQYEAQLKEERRRNDVLLQPDGDVDVRNEEAQRGRRMLRSEFVRRVQKLNPNLWYEQSIHDSTKGGIYVTDLRSPYGKRMAAAMPHDVVNEFSTILTRPMLQPLNATDAQWRVIQEVDQKIPGWRAILLALLKDGLIGAGALDKEFKITQGRSSQRWQEATT